MSKTYGRIHRSFFDSSINDTDVVTRFVFMAMISLSDDEGRLDITRSALAGRIHLPEEDTTRALEVLSQPDPESRTLDFEGRRIVQLDPARSWGWLVVNKEQYLTEDADQEEIRRKNRERQQRKRQRDSSSLDTEPVPSLTDTSLTNTTTTLSPSVTCHAASHGVTLASREKRDAIFARCWSMVPRKEGRKDARRYFDAEIRALTKKAPPDALQAAVDRFAADLEQAIRNYSEQTVIDRIEPRYLMQGRKLFFNFRDYVEKRPPRPTAPRRREGSSGVEL